jgi:hypothetical protein
LDFPASLSTIGKLATLGPHETFFTMRRQGLPLFVCSAFLGVLSLECTTEYVFRIGIAAASEVLVDQLLEIRWQFELHWHSPLLHSGYRDGTNAAS